MLAFPQLAPGEYFDYLADNVRTVNSEMQNDYLIVQCPDLSARH